MGNERLKSQSAFTLIEVMVVVLIIGIIINFVVLSIGSNPADALKKEAQRFISLTQLAAEDALLRSELIGIVVDKDAYKFLLRVEDRWEPIDETVFRNRSLPEEIHLDLLSDQPPQNAKDAEQTLPNIVLLSNGEMTPFELKISGDLCEDIYRITGSETGELDMQHVTPY